jgi:hypothetical protein
VHTSRAHPGINVLGDYLEAPGLGFLPPGRGLAPKKPRLMESQVMFLDWLAYVGEDWFESAEVMQAALASPEGQAVYADAQNFTDVDRLAMLVVRESTIVSG